MIQSGKYEDGRSEEKWNKWLYSEPKMNLTVLCYGI